MIIEKEIIQLLGKYELSSVIVSVLFLVTISFMMKKSIMERYIIKR